MSRLVTISLSEVTPVIEPIALQDVKDYLKIDYTDDDVIITALITAARKKCEKILGSVLVDTNITGTYRQELGGTTVELFYLPIKSVDASGNPLITNMPTDGIIIGTPDDCWLDTAATEMTLGWTAGWANGIPEIIKLAVKKQVAWDYEHRGDDEIDSVRQQRVLLNQPIAPEVQNLLMPYRKTLNEYIL